MLRLILVRHGECAKAYRVIGGRHATSPLTTLGLEQSQLLALHWKRQRFSPDFIFASTATRTRQTAEVLKRVASLRPGFSLVHWHFISAGCPRSPHPLLVLAVQYRDELQEVAQGDWEGKDRLATYTADVNSSMDVRRTRASFSRSSFFFLWRSSSVHVSFLFTYYQ